MVKAMDSLTQLRSESAEVPGSRPPLDADALLTVHDVARILKVPLSWVYERTRRRTRDRLPHIKMGKYVRFRLADIYAYLEKLRRV